MTRPSIQESSRRQNRKQSGVSRTLERNLAAYAFAAGSAGVGLLACAQPAQAKIISTNTNLVVNFGSPVSFDINNDGQNDFSMSDVNFGFAPSGTCTSAQGRHKGAHHRTGRPLLGCGPFDFGLQVTPLETANEVFPLGGTHDDKLCAAALRRGTKIGPNRPFASGPMVMSALYGTSEGIPACPWSMPHSPFLGVKFIDTEGQMHYGWVRVSVRPDYSTVIQGYPYETIPNKPIDAGIASGPEEANSVSPAHELSTHHHNAATLGRLAQGATGLAVWRREDEVAAA